MKRAIYISIGATLLVALIYFLHLASGSGNGPVNGQRLLAASQAYAREMRARGEPLPERVSMDELIARGFLRRDEVRGFDGLEVSVALDVDETSNKALVRARLPEGPEFAVMGDGSVQQVGE